MNADWEDWSLGDHVDIDDMLVAYKKDEVAEDPKDEISMPTVCELDHMICRFKDET